MNLLQTIRAIEGVAAQQPAVNMIVRNDIFRLNAVPDAKYGVFAWLQGEHTSIAGSSLITYNFTFFYVDRLTANKGNEIEVQSVGIETLENIIRTLERGNALFPATYSFRTFNQRFSDECAGAFCNVVIDAPKSDLCPEEYQFLAPVYNEDRGVWKLQIADKQITII